MATVAITLLAGGMVLNGVMSSLRAQATTTAAALMGLVVQASAQAAAGQAGANRVYGISVRWSSAQVTNPATGLVEQDLALVPWYADVDTGTGALGNLHRYATASSFRTLGWIPNSAVRLDPDGVALRFAASDAIASFFPAADSLNHQRGLGGGTAQLMTDGTYLHVCFEPVTCRPHAVYSSTVAPAEGAALATLLSGAANTATGSRAGITDLAALSRLSVYPIEMQVHDLSKGLVRQCLLLYPSGVLEVRRGRS